MSSSLEKLAVPDYDSSGHVEFLQKEFEDQVVLVVGGSRGIGAAVARKVASLGVKEVVINSRAQSHIEAQSLIEELEEINPSKGVRSRYISGDITASGAPERIVQQAALSGRIDSVIISAGTKNDGLFIQMNDEQMRNVLETNFFGPAFIAREAIKQMRKQKPRGGSIVFVSSLAAEGNPGQANYSASKGAINSLVKTLAKEYFGSNIRVNAVAPGLVDTALIVGLSERQKEGLLLATNSDRALTPEEVAEHIVFLASPKRDSSVNGLIIPMVGKGAL